LEEIVKVATPSSRPPPLKLGKPPLNLKGEFRGIVRLEVGLGVGPERGDMIFFWGI
jgi:hypothetical protein